VIFRLLGDFSPIGRFFAYWAIVVFVMLSENTEAAKILGNFFRGQSNA
jgi:hypothetical protein